MRIILLKCGICHHWYRPEYHLYHCPNCAAIPVRSNSTTRFYVNSETLHKLIPIVRGLPAYDGIYSSERNLLASAQLLAD